ncbi:MAG: hypothetical protein ABEK00_03410 [Candidatus Nanohaloarchaea archaeon]
MKKALLALAVVGLVAGVAALPSQAADMAGQKVPDAGESSGAMNNAQIPGEFPGEAEFSGPPSFVEDLPPQQALNSVPGWLFG